MRLFLLVCLLLLSIGSGVVGAADGPGPQGDEVGPVRQQSWLIPSTVQGHMMRARLFRPFGPGPFRLAVINHGSQESARARRRSGEPAFARLTAFLVERGFAVIVPERPGHGATGGPYLESQGECGRPDYVAAAAGAAGSIAQAISFMTAQQFVRPSGVVVIGHSAGGWGALALGAKHVDGVAGVVNFAGGRGGRDRNVPSRNCAPERLIAAAATLGTSARLPSLWLYAQNDTYFSADLSQRMAAAYNGSGGHAEYHLLPPIAGDGHALILADPNVAGWGRLLDDFLRRMAAGSRPQR